jgi:ribonuclease P protein component
LIARIQTRSAFARVRHEGVRVRSKMLSCSVVVDESLTVPQVGYALGRSFGSAVERNRLRRQLRVLVNEVSDRLAPGVYVFGASPRAAGCCFGDLRGQVAQLVTLMEGRSSRRAP